MPSVANRYSSPTSLFARPPARGDSAGRAPVVLMVSGGADSSALLVMAATSALDISDGRGTARIARERLHVLHVNHGLRGLEAAEDEEFVCELAARYGLPCTVRHFDVAAMAKERKGDAANVENLGRELRYQAAAELANELSLQAGTPRSAARIVTAHTANDRAETFFMNAIRGSGTSGLASIPARRNRIVRPLLNRTHEELCDYLRMQGIVWQEDATNTDTRYLRAWVRHEIIPCAQERNPRVIEGVSASCGILSDEDAFLTSLAERAYRELTRRSYEGVVALDAKRLAATEVAIARRIVRHALLVAEPAARLEARHIEGVLQLVAAGTGSLSAPLGIDVRVEHGLVIFRARRSEEGPQAGWLAVPGRFELAGGSYLEASYVAVPHEHDAPSIARAHAAEWGSASVLVASEASAEVGDGKLWVDFPQAGDVLCPFGMHGQSKKLSDLLGEAGIPTAERAEVPVVRTSPTGSVVWVAGVRLDERAKALPSTKQLVELRLVRELAQKG